MSVVGYTTPFLYDERRQLWQDRRIRWDQRRNRLSVRPGESVVQKWDHIEDTKGDNGLGALILSNLRILWIAAHQPKMNLSIGLGTILYVHVNMVDSPTFGRVRSSYVMAQLDNTHFEFIFTSRSDIAFTLFSALDNALRRYRATRLFRDLLIRVPFLVKGDTATIYYGETLLRTIPQCDNLTVEEKFMGTMFVTDRRVIWISKRNSRVNISIPYHQFRGIGTRGTPFELMLVIATLSPADGYTLGFKYSSREVLCSTYNLLAKLYTHQSRTPFYGPMDGNIQYVDDQFVVVDPKSFERDLSPTEQVISPVASDSCREAPPSTDSAAMYSALINTNVKESVSRDVPRDCGAAEALEIYDRENLLFRDIVHTDRQTDDSSHYSAYNEAPSTVEVCGGLTDNKRLVQIIRSNGKLNAPPVRTLSKRESFVVGSTFCENVSQNRRRHLNLCVDKEHQSVCLQRSVSLGSLPCEQMNALPSDFTTGSDDGTECTCPRDCKAEDSSSMIAGLFLSADGEARSPERRSLPYYRDCLSPTCSVCMVSNVEVAFDPCGHLCSCVKCAKKLIQCPICRKNVSKHLRVYFPVA